MRLYPWGMQFTDLCSSTRSEWSIHWSPTDFWQRCQDNSVRKRTVFSKTGAGTTEYLYAKEWSWTPTSHHKPHNSSKRKQGERCRAPSPRKSKAKQLMIRTTKSQAQCLRHTPELFQKYSNCHQSEKKLTEWWTRLCPWHELLHLEQYWICV